MSEKKNAPVESQVPAVPPSGGVPDYIKQTGTARGGENVGVKDIALPRIQLAQSMSPCMKSADPAYIPGIQEGDIYNTLTRENYGAECMVIPVYFRPLYVCWRTRQTGGGFRGSFRAEAEAIARVAAGAQQGEQIEIAETHEHLLLVLDRNSNRIEQAILSMSRTQIKQSRKWNSLMKLAGGDIFAHAYLLTSITESNQRGTYKNWNVTPVGYAPKAAYEQAEELYTQVSTGAVNITAADEATSTDY